VKLFNFRKLVGVSALGLVAILGMSETANAQNRNDQRQERRIDRQQDRIQRQRAKLEQQRARLQRERLQNQRNNRSVYANQNNRYRVYRNGAYYNTNNRGAELLRQAVNAGYQQGYRTGQTDRNGRRNSSWNNSTVLSKRNVRLPVLC